MIELGESEDPNAVKYLITALHDEHVPVSIAAVAALRGRRDANAAMPMYELVQNETAPALPRHAAAEALVSIGLLRRQRVGASRAFLWLLALTLVIVAAATVDLIGPVAGIALFVVGEGALVAYYRRTTRKEREAGVYIGPDRATIVLPPAA